MRRQPASCRTRKNRGAGKRHCNTRWAREPWLSRGIVPEFRTTVASASRGRMMGTTLASLLQSDVVPVETLRQRYGPLLELARTMLGLIPNGARYLEI